MTSFTIWFSMLGAPEAETKHGVGPEFWGNIEKRLLKCRAGNSPQPKSKILQPERGKIGDGLAALLFGAGFAGAAPLRRLMLGKVTMPPALLAHCPRRPARFHHG